MTLMHYLFYDNQLVDCQKMCYDNAIKKHEAVENKCNKNHKYSYNIANSYIGTPLIN